MPRPRVLALLSLVALIVALAVALPAGAAASVPQGFVGMVVGDPVYPTTDPNVDLGTQLDSMVGSGVSTIRVVFNWSEAQPYKSWSQVPADQMGDYTDVGGIPTDFQSMDALVHLAAQRRLTILPVVLYAPGWDAAHHPSGSYAEPARDAPYANFVSALVHRYGPHGTFWQDNSPFVPIRMWQIWNEPNITVFWPKQPFAPAYVSLLRAAHNAIKRADHGAKVVLAGLPNYSWKALGRIYNVRGARGLFDVVAVHPYTKTPSGVVQILSKVRTVMNSKGDRRKPILADEISWPSSQGKTHHTEGFDFATTEKGQARNISTLLPMLARDRGRLGLSGFDYYTWAGVETRGSLAFNFAGLFRISNDQFIAKPAYYSFRRAALSIEHCRQKGSVATVCVKRG